MVVVAAVTGLRRGELVGLKWEDIDFHNSKLHVRRSVVDQKEGLPKTQLSKKPGALEGALAFTLKEWSQQTSYSKASDWVFASPYRAGRTPYWPGTVLEKVIQPAPREAGITKTIGWHTFRRTIATQVVANGESIKTAQEYMRHATPTMTLGTYAQAIPEEIRAAQNRIASLFGLGTDGTVVTDCAVCSFPFPE
jgi:integrase